MAAAAAALLRLLAFRAPPHPSRPTVAPSVGSGLLPLLIFFPLHGGWCHGMRSSQGAANG